MNIINSEKGSILIEGAIIIPIVLIVIIGMMTLAFVFHDIYVSDVFLQTYIEGYSDNKEFTDYIDRKFDDGGTYIERTQNKLILKDITTKYSNEHIRLDKKIDTMVLGEKIYQTDEYDLKSVERLNNVKQIEVLVDAFDSLSISDLVHTKYTMSLKTIMDLLESH